VADRPVVLVGLMGAGKTSVATRLAAALGRDLRDSDADLQRRYGASAAEQSGRPGAGVLHAREAAVLREALAQRPPPVVAAAASVVEDPACRAALAGAFVVWLDAPPSVLADRFRAALAPAAGGPAADRHRPQYHPDPEAMLADQHRRRAGWFRQVADLVVDVGGTTPDQAAATVLAALAGGGGSDRPAGGTIDRSGPPP
jgi:shikimate kinase